jgi:hypothetical protein
VHLLDLISFGLILALAFASGYALRAFFSHRRRRRRD